MDEEYAALGRPNAKVTTALLNLSTFVESF